MKRSGVNSAMKNSVFFAILALMAGVFFTAQQVAVADNLSAYGSAVPQKPKLTPPVYTAMLFYKLAQRVPDFGSWARRTKEYQSAEPAGKLAALAAQETTLKNVYNLLTLQEPLTVEIPVTLSAYSYANGGFFVENFKSSTFFPVRYEDQSFAIVPLGIMDRQWMKVTDEDAVRAIQSASNNKDAPLTMLLTLTPKYADSSTPAKLEGNDYWLISTDIKKMALYAGDSATPLWESEDPRIDAAKRQELLNLRQ